MRQMSPGWLWTVLLSLLVCGCSAPTTRPVPAVDGSDVGAAPDTTSFDPDAHPDGGGAQPSILDVSIEGSPGAYTFHVEVETGDTGCDHYADWWEVISEDGALIYRRILAHSHVDEQPFTRSGGPVNIAADDNVYVRVHMNDTGYGDEAAWISPDGALELLLVDDIASGVESLPPQPDGCAF